MKYIFYAYIEIKEWGEESRSKRIGPFHPEEGLERDPEAAEEQLRRNLAANGDDVTQIETVII